MLRQNSSPAKNRLQKKRLEHLDFFFLSSSILIMMGNFVYLWTLEAFCGSPGFG